MFEKDKWYDQDGTYEDFNGPAQCRNITYDDMDAIYYGHFGLEHGGGWKFNEHFHEVPAPCDEDVSAFATIEEPGHVEKLDQSINDRLARLKEIDQQIADFLTHCEGGRVEEVVPADVRESIRVIFTRG